MEMGAAATSLLGELFFVDSQMGARVSRNCSRFGEIV